MREHDLNLYELETELMETAESITQMEASGNEEDIAAALHALEAYINQSLQKRDNCGKFIQFLNATDDAITDEISRLQDKQKRIRKKREGFSKYILFVMGRLGVKTLEGRLFSFKARLNPVKVIIEDEAKIPAWYKTLDEPKPPELKIDKKAIGEDLKDGKEVPGAHLEQETRLVIDQ